MRMVSSRSFPLTIISSLSILTTFTGAAISAQPPTDKQHQFRREAPSLSEQPQGEKECPLCAELIKREAIKCKHCGSMLNQPSQSGSPPHQSPTPHTVAGDTQAVGTALGVGALCVAGFGLLGSPFMREFLTPLALVLALLGLAKRDKVASMIALLVSAFNFLQIFG